MNINEDFVPATMEQAVDYIVENLTDKDREFFFKHSLSSLHFGLGMHMRNKWSFWEDTPLKRDAAVRFKIAHADDLSGLMWEWVAAKVTGREFEPVSYCERFHKHWREQSKMTSLQAGGVNEKGEPICDACGALLLETRECSNPGCRRY